MALFLRGPEIGDGEAVLEVRAEVVHPADWEGKVHPELGRGSDRDRRDREGGGIGVGRMYFEYFEVGAAEGAEEGGEHR